MKLRKLLTEVKYKDMVLKKYPAAYCEKIKSGKVKGLQNIYYVIRPKFREMYIGIGKTQTDAWKTAFKKIKE